MSNLGSNKYVAALPIHELPDYNKSIIIVFFPRRGPEFIIPNHMRPHYARCTKTSVSLETDEAETITKGTSVVDPLLPRACVSAPVSLLCARVCVLRGHYVTFE